MLLGCSGWGGMSQAVPGMFLSGTWFGASWFTACCFGGHCLGHAVSAHPPEARRCTTAPPQLAALPIHSTRAGRTRQCARTGDKDEQLLAWAWLLHNRASECFCHAADSYRCAKRAALVMPGRFAGRGSTKRDYYARGSVAGIITGGYKNPRTETRMGHLQSQRIR